MVAKCKKCAFYEAVEDDYGICRRNPPDPVRGPFDTNFSQYPPVKEDDYCGEYQQQIGRDDVYRDMMED